MASKTRAKIRELTRTLLSEPTPSLWSDSELNDYINDGLEDFCNETNALEDISTQSSIKHQADYDWPSDATKLKQVEYIKGNTVRLLLPEDLKEQFRGFTRNTSIPDNFGFWGEAIRLSERPSTAAASTTLNGTITSTANTLTLTDSSGMPRTGRILINDEVIEYWNNSSNVLTPLSRGREGTTAAAHTTGDAVTLRDIWVYHFKKETLSSDEAVPDIPTQFHPAPAYYAAAVGRRKSKDHDLATQFMQEYDRFVAKGLTWSKMKWRRKYTPK